MVLSLEQMEVGTDDSSAYAVPASLHLGLDMAHIMKQAPLIVDVQPSFSISVEILRGITELSAILPSVATVERHDESSDAL